MLRSWLGLPMPRRPHSAALRLRHQTCAEHPRLTTRQHVAAPPLRFAGLPRALNTFSQGELLSLPFRSPNLPHKHLGILLPCSGAWTPPPCASAPLQPLFSSPLQEASLCPKSQVLLRRGCRGQTLSQKSPPPAQLGWISLGFEEHFVRKITVAFGHSRKEGKQLYSSR